MVSHIQIIELYIFYLALYFEIFLEVNADGPFLNDKIKTELIVITKNTLKIIENPDAKLFLEKFYSRLKAVTSEEQWIELFMELSAIMYFDFPLAVVN